VLELLGAVGRDRATRVDVGVDQRGERFGLGAVVDQAPFRPMPDQARQLQDAEVLGHRRLRYPGVVGQGANGQLAVADQALEDRATCRVGEGFEHLVRSGLHR